jgi:replicative DNA helicase
VALNIDEQFLYSRIPPQNAEAEEAVLGSVLIEAEALVSAMELLQSRDFYSPAHQMIFEAMIALTEQSSPVDILTVSSYLMDHGSLEEIGGVSYLSDLSSSVPTAANVGYYAQLVQEKSLQRRVIREATQIAQLGYNTDNDVEELIAEAETRIMGLSEQRTHDFIPVREVLMMVYEQIEHMHQNKGNMTGVSSGFADLDKLTTGFQKNDLIIVAARPSVGKTAFALNIVQNAGVRGHETVAIFSLEMSAAQLVQRMISAEGNVDSARLRTGTLEGDDWDKVTMAISSLSEAQIYIDDTPTITVQDIRAKCRRLKKEHGLGMIVIDYLQLISGRRGGNGENRQQEVSEISRTLKQIARELEVPVIALSQLSRGVEQRQDKRPLMSDLRESGSIEQDADIVAFLYRDDYYNQDSEKKNIIEIIIAKQRNGPVGTVELLFLKNFNKFRGLEQSMLEPGGSLVGA